MTLVRGKDSTGVYYRYDLGTKFYYNPNSFKSRIEAHIKAIKQMNELIRYK